MNAVMDISRTVKIVFRFVNRDVYEVNASNRMFASVILDTLVLIVAFNASVTDIQIVGVPTSWMNVYNATIIRLEQNVTNANPCSLAILVTMVNVKGLHFHLKKN